MCYGLGAWCLSTWKVSLVMLRAVETFWEIFRICKTPGFLQHSWRLSIGDSYGRHTAYRPVAPGDLLAGAPGDLRVAHVPGRWPSPPECALESGAARTAPGPKRYETRVHRKRSSYR